MSYGLVLEGGGARGSFHIGVWKALRELKIEITAVTGTSVGALNGALIALDKYDEAVELWANIQTKDVLEVDYEVFNELFYGKRKLDNIESYISFLKDILDNKGLNITPLKNMMTKYMNEDELRNAPIDFGFVTVSITDKKPMEVYLEDIAKGKVQDYLLASSCLPIFQSEELDGKRFIDGCFFDNLPIHLLVRKGYKKIIAVHLNAFGFKQKVKEDELEMIHIYPSGELGSSLLFHPIQSRQNMTMGYLDTLKAFEQLYGNQYYLKDVPAEEAVFQMFLGLPDSWIVEMTTLQSKKIEHTRRILLEQLIPQLSKFLDVPEDTSYQFLYLTLLEYAAETIGFYRLKIYDYAYFRNMVMQKYCTYEKPMIEEENLKNSTWVVKNKKRWVLYQWIHTLWEMEEIC